MTKYICEDNNETLSKVIYLRLERPGLTAVKVVESMGLSMKIVMKDSKKRFRIRQENALSISYNLLMQ